MDSAISGTANRETVQYVYLLRKKMCKLSKAIAVVCAGSGYSRDSAIYGLLLYRKLCWGEIDTSLPDFPEDIGKTSLDRAVFP